MSCNCPGSVAERSRIEKHAPCTATGTQGRGFSRSGLLWALAVSFAVHVLVLWPAPVRMDDGLAATAPLRTSFVDARLREKPASTRAAPVVGRTVRPDRLPGPGRAPAEPAGFRPSGTADTWPSPQSPAGYPAGIVPSLRALPDDIGLDADGLRQFRVGLAVAARRFRNYPPQARASRQAGNVEVRLILDAAGRALPPQIIHGSGHEILDAAALDTIAGAASAVIIPESLRGQTFGVDIPLEFSIAAGDE